MDQQKCNKIGNCNPHIVYVCSMDSKTRKEIISSKMTCCRRRHHHQS